MSDDTTRTEAALLDELDDARAEIERLREALDEIDHYTYGWSFSSVSWVIDKIRLTARAASEPVR